MSLENKLISSFSLVISHLLQSQKITNTRGSAKGQGESFIYAPFNTVRSYCSEVFNPFPNKSWFLRVCITSL